ncbi:MAG: hypothetical protein L3V56_07245 [Candidatus Magnetoovum sp. WYHC-5]|nr:hypothetical protein [Candidatus Magnetoovum sp. WYHC-5]
MKTTFFSKIINGPLHDPIVYVRFTRQKNAFIFDLGEFSYLSPKELLSISNVFISHMHIDHFIGFDRLLRHILLKEEPVCFYGPDGIINAIDAKLRGFTWNVVKGYPLKIEVFEAKKERLEHASFYASEGFNIIRRPSILYNFSLYNNDGLYVNTCIFDHDIPVLGFSLEEDFHININKDLLNSMGLTPGPWLNELKKSVRYKQTNKPFQVDGKTFSYEELSKIAIIAKGQKISYITDISPSKENIQNAIKLAANSDILYIEAYFLHEELQRAIERNHLTAKIAGMIGRLANVQNIYFIHISPKYFFNSENVVKEALDEFNKGCLTVE